MVRLQQDIPMIATILYTYNVRKANIYLYNYIVYFCYQNIVFENIIHYLLKMYIATTNSVGPTCPPTFHPVNFLMTNMTDCL